MCLDINGILCSFISHNHKNLHDKSTRKSKYKKDTLIARPQLDRFLSLINSAFDIMLYTSRTEKNARAILDELKEKSYLIKDVVENDDMLLHQTQCEKISNKRFKKDLQKVWALTQDANGNNYKMHDILMIDDSPDKFDRFKDHVIIFQTLIHDEKESQLLCDKQYSFLQCLKKIWHLGRMKNQRFTVWKQHSLNVAIIRT